ncbi:MAG: KTSC domain-containing protein [Actinomycetota bacterium]|nr:KTSC domain-containing protein [Actinomycetota bacterium]
MKLVPVESSVIASVGYEDAASSLTIVFKDGHVYEFHLVPRSIFEDFLASGSKGSFFNERLRDGPYGRSKTRKA